jgi:hypothetical protein
MDGFLSDLQYYVFAFASTITTLYVVLRWVLKETGKFIKFFRDWWNDTFPPSPPVDNSGVRA